MPRNRIVPAVAKLAKTIVSLRGQNVLLDADLAALYGVDTKTLLRAVKRNIDRFPGDFMFHLSKQEVIDLRCQFGTSSGDAPVHGGRRYLPYAFTEQGVAMLSSVLNSPRAVQVNIEIMRAFIRLRGALLADTSLARKLEQLESRLAVQDSTLTMHTESISEIVKAIHELIAPHIGKAKRRGLN